MLFSKHEAFCCLFLFSFCCTYRPLLTQLLLDTPRNSFVCGGWGLIIWPLFHPRLVTFHAVEGTHGQGILATSTYDLSPFTINPDYHHWREFNSPYLSFVCLFLKNLFIKQTICLFLKNKFYLYIYFWLCWVFVAARRLSLVASSRGYSPLQCTGFSSWCLLLLWSTGSRHTGFNSCGTWA